MIKKFALTLSVAVLLGGAGSAMAGNPPLTGVTNGDFSSYSGPYSPKNYFTSVNPTNWSLTPGSGNLVFIDSAATYNQSAAGPVYLTTWANPVGAGVTGTYLEADGNPYYADSISQTITGLTPGQTYSLGFYQAASQQSGFYGQTTNRWIVSLGTSALQLTCCGYAPVYGPTDLYYNPDAGASVAASPLMIVPTYTATNWTFVTVNLKADASTQVLSFLAWGDEGATNNLPPMAFLTDVGATGSTGVSVPEPAVWTMMCIGILGVGGLARSRRRGAAAAATA